MTNRTKTVLVLAALLAVPVMLAAVKGYSGKLNRAFKSITKGTGNVALEPRMFSNDTINVTRFV